MYRTFSAYNHRCSGLDASLVADETDEIDDVSSDSSAKVPKLSVCLVVLAALTISVPRTVATISSAFGDRVVEEGCSLIVFLTGISVISSVSSKDSSFGTLFLKIKRML